jgi:UPF0755 protein
MFKYICIVVPLIVALGAWYITGQLYRSEPQQIDEVQFTIESGESIAAVASRLESERVIVSGFWFIQYLKWKELDRAVRAGTFTVEAPITIKRVAEVLQRPSQSEREITILPGWTLREIATYLESEGFGSVEQVYAYMGTPATVGTSPTLTFDMPPRVLQEIPSGISLEGYVRPDTFRIFTNATLEEILQKLVLERNKQFTPELLEAIEKSGRTLHEIMIVASLLEKEVRGRADKKIAADIFWKRYDAGWAMQADSSIHYIHGSTGSVFTTREMRESLNSYNTYKYPGLPPGPIATPSLMAVEAAVYPTPNDYWYFITTLDTGEAKFGRTLDDHNRNVQRYLR